jgi:hypothetical protein
VGSQFLFSRVAVIFEKKPPKTKSSLRIQYAIIGLMTMPDGKVDMLSFGQGARTRLFDQFDL